MATLVYYREYLIQITVNGRAIRKVVIDTHFELKHNSSINDRIILELVHMLANGIYEPEAENEEFQYFVADNLVLHQKRYKLVWLLERNAIYIGVINAYRRSTKALRRK